MKEIERGCTKIEGTGGYSKEPCNNTLCSSK